MYDLSPVIASDALSEVRPGSSLLVAGPAMTGKDDLVYDILADGSRRGEGAVIVSTGARAESVVDRYRDRVGDDDIGLGVVDCVSDSEESVEGVITHSVNSPGDLTGIGIGITKALDGLQEREIDRGRLALTSLSTILTYTDRKKVFKFCHVLSSRLEAADYLGLFTIDTGAHEDQTIQVIKQAFDGMIEIREQNGRREARVRGLQAAPGDWTEI
ncbi:MAG: RAD55 family ATPase [Halococcoides sp.]